MPAADADDEPPLDPALERLQAKLRRLLLVSGGIMALGLLAVFAVILYRVTRADPARPVAAPALPGPAGPLGAGPDMARLELPVGARLLSVVPMDGRLLVTIALAEGGLVLLVDPQTLAVLRRLELGASPR